MGRVGRVTKRHPEEENATTKVRKKSPSSVCVHDLQVTCVRVWPLHGGCAIRARGMLRGMRPGKRVSGRACIENGGGAWARVPNTVFLRSH